MKLPEMVIIVDSREQRPLTFTHPTERGTLPTGDYSVLGLEDRISIERKSIDDLIGCLKDPNRERFERELVRGREFEYFALVVETDLNHLAEHKYQSAMTPAAVIQSLLAFSVRYRLPIFFCQNRLYTARVIESLLQKFVREKRRNDIENLTCIREVFPSG